MGTRWLGSRASVAPESTFLVLGGCKCPNLGSSVTWVALGGLNPSQKPVVGPLEVLFSLDTLISQLLKTLSLSFPDPGDS